MPAGRLHVRIDNRLLHGQVVQFWIPYLEVEHLLIADDLAASNTAMAAVYRMAVPRRIRLSVVSMVELLGAVKESNALPSLIIMGDVFDFARAYMNGFRCAQITLGNIHSAPGRIRVTDTVYLTPEELEALSRFSDADIRVQIQTFPGESLNLIKGKDGGHEWLRP